MPSKCIQCGDTYPGTTGYGVCSVQCRRAYMADFDEDYYRSDSDMVEADALVDER